ncbi:Uncharacterized protein dnm_032110 [Desulfonema magnum]|uniref:Uncharacterized protein n=1 Tax=Desulfonema magnum TaxID=45655 RepID=A0A975BKI7_9BACT|nr:Uncharacterized protein dnm_032110 [Desulfonema magnum]
MPQHDKLRLRYLQHKKSLIINIFGDKVQKECNNSVYLADEIGGQVNAHSSFC